MPHCPPVPTFYCSCHVAMMKMMILRTYKCNSLDCFDSNMCLIYYSRHGAMMKMVYCGLIHVIRWIVSIVIVFIDVYDVIQHYVHLSIIRCRIVACRKRPLDR